MRINRYVIYLSFLKHLKRNNLLSNFHETQLPLDAEAFEFDREILQHERGQKPSYKSPLQILDQNEEEQ